MILEPAERRPGVGGGLVPYLHASRELLEFLQLDLLCLPLEEDLLVVGELEGGGLRCLGEPPCLDTAILRSSWGSQAVRVYLREPSR